MKKPFILNVIEPSEGALDFSYLLDAPAGKHGFLKTANGKFIFEDGTKIRFFGVNLSKGGIMPDKSLAVIYAERLAKSGVNMVRLHYGDSNDSNSTDASDISLIDYSKGNSRFLNKDNLDRLDFFVNELKKRGIYIHIDLFVARVFQPGDNLDYNDSLDIIPPMIKIHRPLKQANIINKRLVDLQKEYAQQYLTHLNPYTGYRYIDDPAIAVVQVMNENSLFDSFCGRNSTGSLPPSYVQELDEMWNNWLMKIYGSREALDEAWTNEYGEKCLDNGEDPEISTVYRPDFGSFGQPCTDYKLDYHGKDSPARYADYMAFLSEVELEFCKDMREYLISLGVKCPINMSNLTRGVADTYSLSVFEDVVENNAYYNHPDVWVRTPLCRFKNKEMYSSDPRDYSNIITNLSNAAIKGKPFLVTEWNNVYPTKFSSETILMLAAYGSLQDWDGLLLYSYSHYDSMEKVNIEKMNGYFNVFNDPATWGQMGTCAAIFQSNMIKTAKNSIDLCYTSNDIKFKLKNWMAPFGTIPFISQIRCCFIREKYEGDADVALASGFTPIGDYSNANKAIIYSRSPYSDLHQQVRGKERFLNSHMEMDMQKLKGIGSIGSKMAVISNEEKMDSDYRAYSEIIDDILKRWGILNKKQGLLQPGKLISDTGELIFNFYDGEFIIDTKKVIAYAGNIDKEIKLGKYDFRIANKKMAISIFPRDGKDLDISEHLLITAVGEKGNTDMEWKGLRLLDEGREPIWIDQIEGMLEIDGCFSSCSAYALKSNGERGEKLQATIGDNKITILLDSKLSTIYYEILITGF